ncbi:hypothetical protein ABZ342_31345 [Amycolatopsis sp. NPDC005961]|uniref:hypothetical protein n=1 Tax=Amycolatopsis sp. NPDC005961 TaxID=3156720 RepID=UPI003404A618
MDEDYARKLRAWLRAEPGATPRRAEEEREWLREVPAPATGDHHAEVGDAASESWSVRGQLPDTEEEWVCPVIMLPVPRSSKENGCRLSGPADRRRRTDAADHPATPAAEPRPMSEAEARSRWNHPSNWHRRRREAQGTEEPGSR